MTAGDDCNELMMELCYEIEQSKRTLNNARTEDDIQCRTPAGTWTLLLTEHDEPGPENTVSRGWFRLGSRYADAQTEPLAKNHAFTAQTFVIYASNHIDDSCFEWMEKILGAAEQGESRWWAVWNHSSVLSVLGRAVRGF